MVGDARVRIDMVAPFPPPYGGMGVRFERLTEILQERGYACRKVTVKWVDGGSLWRTIRRLLVFIGCAWQVFRSDAQIVHTTTGSVPNAFAISIVMLAARLARRKVMLSIGGGKFSSFSLDAMPVKRWALRVLVFSLPHLILPCNEELARALINLGVECERIVRISNALPDEVGSRELEPVPESFTSFRESHHPLLLYVGAMHPYYGLLDVVVAVERLRQRWPSIGLVALVKKGGDAEYASEIAAYADVWGLNEALAVFESVPWAVAAMRQSSVLVRAKSVAEGDSRAVREALAVGLPAVTSDAGYRPAKARLYRAGDVDDLERALAEVLEGDLVQELYIDPEGEANIRRYERLYWDLLRG